VEDSRAEFTEPTRIYHDPLCSNQHYSVNECNCFLIEQVRNSLYDNPFDWIEFGVKKGWVTEPSCYTHDGPILTEEEAALWDEGHDPCMFVLRIWND